MATTDCVVPEFALTRRWMHSVTGAIRACRRLSGVGMLAVLAGCAATGPGGRPEPEAVVAQVLNNEAVLSRIWPGFWQPGTAFLVFDPDGDALLRSQEPPPAGYAPFRPEPESAWRDLLDASVYQHPGRPDGLADIFAIDYPVGDQTLTAVPVENSVVDTIATLFHESFHGYQHEHFEIDPATLDTLFVPPEAITATMLALARMEQEVLAAALQAESDAGRHFHARSYLALRHHRLAMMPDHGAVLERFYARNEGMATLVAARGVSLLYHGDDRAVAQLVRDNFLSEHFLRFSESPVDSILRWRQYGVGAAIGWILERNGPRDWEQGVEQGRALDAMLAEAVDFAPDQAPGIVAELLAGVDFSRRVAETERWLARLDLPSADQVRNARRRLIIQFADACKNGQGGFRGNPVRVEAEAVLVRATSYHSNNDCMALTLQRTLVLEERGAGGLLRLQIPLRRWPRVDWPDSGSRTMETDSLAIKRRGFVLRLRAQARITQTHDELRIEFLSATGDAEAADRNVATQRVD